MFTRDFLLGTLVNFLLYVNYYVPMVVMANYCLATYQTDLGTAGFAASVFILGALLARFVSPLLIAKFGRKPLLVVGAAAMALLSAAYLLDSGVAGLFALRFLHGFFYGMAQTTVTSITTESVPDEHKGEGIGYYMLSVTVGSAVGPFLGTFLMQNAGFPVLFLVCVGVAGAGTVAAIALHDAKARARSSAGEKGESKAAEKKSGRKVSLGSFLEASVFPISSIAGLVFLAYGSVLTYLNAYASQLDLAAAASFFFVFYAATMFVSRPFTGRWFDSHGDRAVMALGFVAMVAGLAVLSQAKSEVPLFAAACLMGFGVGSIQPSGLTLAVQRAPEGRFDVANSTYFIFLDAAVGLCPLIFGWTIPALGYGGLFLTLAVVVALAAAAYFAMRARRLI